MDIKKIPLTSIIQTSTILPDVYIAKSAIVVTDKDNTDYLVSGFGFSKISEIATLKAANEFWERFFALKMINKQRRFNVVILNSSQVEPRVVKIYSSKVLLSRNIPLSASGLSCHSDLNFAINHAVLELLERHLCAVIWYGSKMPIQTISTKMDCYNNRIETYSLAIKDSLPFALTSITNCEKQIFILTSAFKHTLNESVRHSEMEAYMIYENLFRSNMMMFANKSTKHRMLSLQSDKFLERQSHLLSKLSYKFNSELLPSDLFTLEDIIKHPLFVKKKIGYTLIYSDSQYKIVRAISKQLKTLENCRNSNYNFIGDPFC